MNKRIKKKLAKRANFKTYKAYRQYKFLCNIITPEDLADGFSYPPSFGPLKRAVEELAK